VLTDPWFSEKSFYHPGEPIALQPGELPPLDAVIISHHHVDHCDLAAFAAYRDKGVPMMVARPVAPPARAAGFTDVRVLEPWQAAAVGDLTVTAAPGKHAVYEITFVISAGGAASTSPATPCPTASTPLCCRSTACRSAPS
jgi:L-ascorbate metabolism protein UlaG (beta-lactamase superfamily)